MARFIPLFLALILSDFFSGTGNGLPDAPTGRLRLIFYNVENLFDTFNDPGKDDDAFTPDGDRRWNQYRLRNKINNIYKALVSAAEFEIPAIIGLCEVENMHVLEMLATQTGLKNHDYRIIHRNSSDRRGIDVAVLYRPEDFIPLDTLFLAVRFPFDTLAATRDILYLKGLARGADTLYLFVNHWPSRWGGQAVTEPYRIHTASVLRSFTDSLLLQHPDAAIVIMGDFNDEPSDISLIKHLFAGLDADDPESGKLYNISYTPGRSKKGSCKYQGEWFLFDQFIVSGSLLNGSAPLQTCQESFRVFSAGFLLIPDESWFGFKPFRSYEGFRYTGGFSDHLPVVLDLWW
jgi:predicted extracellular nuclease